LRTLRGIPASPGTAIGPAAIIRPQEVHVERQRTDDPAAEQQRLLAALQIARAQLDTIYTHARATVGEEEAAIFEAQATMLDDPALLEVATGRIVEQGCSAEAAWSDAVETYATQLQSLANEYLAARAADLRDVGQRVLRVLAGRSDQGPLRITEPSVIVARDLTPSETVQLDKAQVLGFVTAAGGPTSHTAILAKALGLPAVVGVGDDVLSVEDGTQLVVDGTAGQVIVAPDAATLSRCSAQISAASERARAEREAAQAPAVTRDGHRVEVVANVGGREDAELALANGAEGIGLLRTEFLYLDRCTPPSEEEQFAAYASILQVMGSRPVVVRTLDVGGDKYPPYMDLGAEANPFLGWRAIRVCLDEPELFKAQLRALLRAGVGHDLHIMFPMIATLEELRRSMAYLAEARHEVEAKGCEAAPVKVGIMVEVPSVVVLADIFAREVDFFSIGTNDLTQYTMAAERTNPRVAHLNDACHPAVLRQISQVVKAAHAAGTWVGICGELGGDPDALPILLGLGVDELSMAPSAIPHAKAVLRQWSLARAQRLARQVLELESAASVRNWVRSTEPA